MGRKSRSNRGQDDQSCEARQVAFAWESVLAVAFQVSDTLGEETQYVEGVVPLDIAVYQWLLRRHIISAADELHFLLSCHSQSLQSVGPILFEQSLLSFVRTNLLYTPCYHEIEDCKAMQRPSTPIKH